MKDRTGLSGIVRYKLLDSFGEVKQEGIGCNIVTTQGDRYFVDQLSDAGAGAVDLMALGTGTANVDKADTWVSGPFSGNGSATGTAGGVSAITNAGTPGNLQYVGTFSAGYATQDGITRVILTDLDPSADGNGIPNGTTTFCVAHGTISPTVNKGANDTLVVTWDITFLGA
jgi:hypothetical protein